MKSPGRNLRSDIHGVAEAQPGHSMLRAWHNGEKGGAWAGHSRCQERHRHKGRGRHGGQQKGSGKSSNSKKNRW